nr:hypothetical protein [uncultured Cohaesibacter sp.]
MALLASKSGLIGRMLVIVSVIGLLFAGASVAPVSGFNIVSQSVLDHQQATKTTPHCEAKPCSDCAVAPDTTEHHCGAKIFALSSVLAIWSTPDNYTVAAYIRSYIITHSFSPDPPPPRFA